MSLIEDTNTAEQISTPEDLTELGSKLYFRAYRSLHGGRVLYESDGTVHGTKVVRYPSGEPIRANAITVMDGQLVVLAEPPHYGPNVWTIDAGGTLEPVGSSSGRYLIPVGEKLYAGGYYGIDLIDPAAGRVDTKVTGVRVQHQYSSNSDGIYFREYTAEAGTETWFSDGTQNGTRLLTDLVPGPDGSQPYEFFTADDEVYLRAIDPEGDRHLYRAKPGGLEKVSNKPALVSGEVVGTRNDLLFTRYGASIYGYDKSGEYQFLVSLLPRQSPGTQTDPVLFTYGENVWESDGTAEGTGIVYATQPDDRWARSALRHSTIGVVAAADELWLEGAEEPLRVNIQPGTQSTDRARAARYENGVVFHNRHWSSADVWSTDGETAAPLLSRWSDTNFTQLTNAVVMNGLVYSVGRHVDGSYRVTWTDGIRKPRGVGGAHQSISHVAASSDTVYFSRLYEVYSTNGRKVDFGSLYPNLYAPRPVGASGSRMLFVASERDDTQNKALLITDATTAGTQVLATLRGYSNPVWTPGIGDQAFFQFGSTYWTTDGTVAGTRQIGRESNNRLAPAMLRAGNHIVTVESLGNQKHLVKYDAATGERLGRLQFSSMENAQVAADRIFVTTSDAIYETDLTVQGTRQIASTNNMTTGIAVIGEDVVISQDDRLWSIDIHGVRTQLESDTSDLWIPKSSRDTTFEIDGRGIVFADDDLHGMEPRRVHLDPGIVVTNKAAAVTEGETSSMGVRLRAKPDGDVTLRIRSNKRGQATVTERIEFTPENWFEPQSIGLTGRNDARRDGDALVTISISVAAGSAGSYDGVTYPDTTVTVVDLPFGSDLRGTTLHVLGSETADQISVSVAGTGAIVDINGRRQKFHTPVDSVVVRSRAGDDDILVQGDVGARILAGDGADSIVATVDRAVVYGEAGDDEIHTGNGADRIFGGGGSDLIDSGAGNDYVNAGAGRDIVNTGSGDDTGYGAQGLDAIDGGQGNDLLFGGAGRDVLVGGVGEDILRGGKSDDLLIAGSLTVPDVRAALAAIMAEWSSPRTYEQRVDNLTGTTTGGRNGTHVLSRGTTVTADAEVDQLFGGGGRDWFFGVPPADIDGDRLADELLD